MGEMFDYLMDNAEYPEDHELREMEREVKERMKNVQKVLPNNKQKRAANNERGLQS